MLLDLPTAAEDKEETAKVCGRRDESIQKEDEFPQSFNDCQRDASTLSGFTALQLSQMTSTLNPVEKT